MKKEIRVVRSLENWKLFLIVMVVLVVILVVGYYFLDVQKKTYYFLEDNKCIKVKEFPGRITFSHYEKLGDCEQLVIAECQVDNDCVKVQTGCCGCEMGGEEKCVLKSKEQGYLKQLEECSPMTLCSAVYLCEIESCRCVEGVCVG